MEIPAFVVGTSGLIAVTQVCLKAAAAIEGMKSFREESAALYEEYNFEQIRFRLWASDVLGISLSPLDVGRLTLRDAQLPAFLTSESPINLEQPLQSALLQVEDILVKLQALLEKYGAGKSPGIARSGTDVSLLRRASFQTRVYKEGGKDEIQKHLSRFKGWNDRLEGIVESRMRHRLASSLHVQVLSSARTDQRLSIIQQAAQTNHPSLSEEAAFRRQLLSIEFMSGSVTSDLKVPAEKISPKFPPNNIDIGLREIGTLIRSQNVNVLQEWKFGQSNWGPDEISTAMDRAERLAQMLCLKSKPSRLRCLDLVAYAIKDSGVGDRTRLDFCFMYQLPPTSPIIKPATLESAIATLSEKRRPALAQSFNIAAMLAESVLDFHVNEWLHKAICSRNVLFFHNENVGHLDFSAPFMAGFEFARPDTVRDQTLDSFGGSHFDVFCHPDLRQVIEGSAAGRPRYQRQYDIYGLGVTLLELGCWMTLKDEIEGVPGTKRHEVLVKICRNVLPSRMGTKYKDAVNACLTWMPDAEKTAGVTAPEDIRTRRASQIEEFMYKVARPLRDCHCGSS